MVVRRRGQYFTRYHLNTEYVCVHMCVKRNCQTDYLLCQFKEYRLQCVLLRSDWLVQSGRHWATWVWNVLNPNNNSLAFYFQYLNLCSSLTTLQNNRPLIVVYNITLFWKTENTITVYKLKQALSTLINGIPCLWYLHWQREQKFEKILHQNWEQRKQNKALVKWHTDYKIS
jgi:hypothetical protein